MKKYLFLLIMLFCIKGQAANDSIQVYKPSSVLLNESGQHLKKATYCELTTVACSVIGTSCCFLIKDDTAKIVCLSAFGITGICCYIGHLVQLDLAGKKLQLASNGLGISYNF